MARASSSLTEAQQEMRSGTSRQTQTCLNPPFAVLVTSDQLFKLAPIIQCSARQTSRPRATWVFMTFFPQLLHLRLNATAAAHIPRCRQNCQTPFDHREIQSLCIQRGRERLSPEPCRFASAGRSIVAKSQIAIHLACPISSTIS